MESTENTNKIIIGGALLSKLDLPENRSPKGKKNALAALYDLFIMETYAERLHVILPLHWLRCFSVDQAWTIISNRTSNLDNKAKIVFSRWSKLETERRETETLVSVGVHGTVVTLMDPSKNVTERGKRKAKSSLELLHKTSQLFNYNINIFSFDFIVGY
ncbi:hypothetical protein HID58_089465 [Brassica napus]|uniref:Uncharacterized protein n=1 Tax=Brassica napus TaxID=3708 RepID=A0ABQ7XZ51_BRANA|nr:hypothetical protein HID58_089465 [Brassica napus]